MFSLRYARMGIIMCACALYVRWYMEGLPSSVKNSEAWERLADRVGGEVGARLAESIRSLYSLYSAGLVDWFVGLYDADIGGFYYSQSARDNDTVEIEGKAYKLLPDAESTYQALRFIRSSGMSSDNFDKSIPEWMRRDIVKFIYNLQDPDGFFYHPQWGKDIGVSRRGRDLWWAKDMLSVLGSPMKYPTMDSAAPAEKKELLIPDHLKSREAFREYLESFDIDKGSYGMGNTLASQNQQIKAMGYMDMCADYLTAHQHADTGHWHFETSYSAINGLMKISGVYNLAERAIPHALEGARSAIEALIAPEPIVGIVDLWNTWVAINQLASNQRRFGGEEGERLADEIVREVWTLAPRAIEVTKEKITPFKKEMGSFSYCRDFPAPRSQGAVVTVPLLWEGDVNATLMATSELTTAIYSSLALKDDRVWMFGHEEYERYLSLLEAKRR